MSNDQPPPGQSPDDDPFLKRPQGPPSSEGPSGGPSSEGPPGPPGGPPPGSPYGAPYGSPYGGDSGQPPGSPYDQDRNAYGGSPFGGTDPLAGMPPLAPFGKRLAARIIDALIIFIPLAILSGFFGNWHAQANSSNWGDFTNQVNTGTQWLWSVISVVAYVGYDTLMTRKTGQTLGKRWMKLRVAMLNNGAVPDTGSALLRAIVLWLPALLCCLVVWWAVIILSILVSRPYRQGLHDKAARTVVVVATEQQPGRNTRRDSAAQ
ncbi:RDD family protein [Streptomyces sp. NPDC059743]|uniref:RDD family protein n=1 Tax=Streptomyces sp. NPDC059743 TaxID=3346928 RepID=UPI00365867AA